MSDNPQAFPWYIQTNGTTTDGGSGMTLRDWFAGQAMAAILAKHPPVVGTASELSDDLACTARGAYSIADAMLTERAK